MVDKNSILKTLDETIEYLMKVHSDVNELHRPLKNESDFIFCKSLANFNKILKLIKNDLYQIFLRIKKHYNFINIVDLQSLTEELKKFVDECFNFYRENTNCGEVHLHQNLTKCSQQCGESVRKIILLTNQN